MVISMKLIDNIVIKRVLLNVIYPNKCMFCGEIINTKKSCCDSCRDKIVKVPDDVCHTCLRKSCICNDLPYKKLLTNYFYDDLSKHSILNLKFNGVRKHAASLAAEIVNNLSRLCLLEGCSAVIPVPMYNTGKRLRGYNQSEIICKNVTAISGIPTVTDLLYKVVDTKKQHDLDKTLRQTNLIGAYRVKNGERFMGKKVLLIDDVYTTGNTIKECCTTLRGSGIEDIYVATFLNANPI